MDKLEQLKNNLYELARKETPGSIEDMNKIFAREIEIPVSKVYDIDSDEDWFDINDYLSE